jgi:hypothetical protein
VLKAHTNRRVVTEFLPSEIHELFIQRSVANLSSSAISVPAIASNVESNVALHHKNKNAHSKVGVL